MEMLDDDAIEQLMMDCNIAGGGEGGTPASSCASTPAR